MDGLFPSCTCEDFELTGRECKHMIAVRLWLDAGEPGPAPKAERTPVPKRPTYRQDWPAYNHAQQTEGAWFLSLLADLTATIPEPERKNQCGRPIPLAG